MLQSMTGFGTSTATYQSVRGTLELEVEIKTVNSKFLDVSVRSPRLYVQFDSEITKFIKTKLRRGRVDVSVSLKVLKGQAHDIIVNIEQAEALKTAYQKVIEELDLTGSVQLSDLLKFPDWIESEDPKFDASEEWTFLKRSLEVALNSVLASRLQEGRSLEDAIRQHRNRFGEVFEQIAAQHDELIRLLRERAKERLRSIVNTESLDPQRIEQEILLWVAKSDFQEEIDRIKHHLQTFDALVAGNGELGRKLEFLVQELLREVNTLGSKCADAKVIPFIIELKSSIERIREQIQNIE